MILQHALDVTRAELRKVATWVRLGLLASLPFASEIKQTLSDNLPALQPYLPENVYKYVGGTVIVIGMVLSLANAHRATKAANDA